MLLHVGLNDTQSVKGVLGRNMSGFELVTVTFSFILGLGVARILSSASIILRQRRELTLHWIPLSLAAAIFFFHVQFWFALFELDSVIEQWTWVFYWPLLALAVLLFLSGGAVLPPSTPDPGVSLLEDFESRGNISLPLLGAYVLGWIPLNAWQDGTWLGSGVLINLAAAASLGLAYWPKSRGARAWGVLSYLAIQVHGVLFVWSTPDVLG